jgi:hypothetical protein
MAKADKALVARRLDDILRIRLDGAEWWDTCAFVREKEKEPGSAWFLAEGAKPLSDGQIRRYQTRADALMMQSHERSRKKLLRRHLAQRRYLYSKASLTGDVRTALAVLRDEAALRGLYDRQPAKVPEQPVETDKKKCLQRSLAFWQGVVQSGAPLAERMRAQEHIDKLLGLEGLEVEERLAALEAQAAKNRT